MEFILVILVTMAMFLAMILLLASKPKFAGTVTGTFIAIAGVGGLFFDFKVGEGTLTLTKIACALILGIVTNLIVRKGATPAGEEPKPQQLIK